MRTDTILSMIDYDVQPGWYRVFIYSQTQEQAFVYGKVDRDW